jgi:hypothetical protein
VPAYVQYVTVLFVLGCVSEDNVVEDGASGDTSGSAVPAEGNDPADAATPRSDGALLKYRAPLDMLDQSALYV